MHTDTATEANMATAGVGADVACSSTKVWGGGRKKKQISNYQQRGVAYPHGTPQCWIVRVNLCVLCCQVLVEMRYGKSGEKENFTCNVRLYLNATLSTSIQLALCNFVRYGRNSK